jgi:hypothetical protein
MKERLEALRARSSPRTVPRRNISASFLPMRVLITPLRNAPVRWATDRLNSATISRSGTHNAPWIIRPL